MTKKNKIMETKNIYAIKIDDMNSDWVNYRLWKNGEDIEPDDLTVEEMIIFRKELLDISEMFNDKIKYIENIKKNYYESNRNNNANR